ncbi:MAG TPA: ice-binding family protein, partial [Pyrinomonadaceae bacterium]
MKMNLRFYLVTLSALALAAVMGLLLVPGVSTSGTVSAAKDATETRGEIATPEMIAYALTHKSDAGFRYNVINQLPCQELSGDLDGKTVAPGVYCLGSANLASDLTLDGQGDKASTFIFRIAGALTAKGGSVSLANDAQAANVFFVAEAATLTDGADFRGNILTNKSINIEDGSVLRGKTESLSGEVAAAENAVAGGGTGTLEICKALDASSVDISNRIFQFTVSGVAGVIEVPVGSCSSPIDVPAGPQTVTELGSGRTISGGTFTGNFVLNRVETLSQNSTSTLGLVNLSTRQATVNVVEGGIPQQLSLRFVNQFAITGFVEICKAASTGPTTGGGGAPPLDALGDNGGGSGTVFNNPNGDPDVTGFFNFIISGVLVTNTQNPTVRTQQVFTTPVGQCTGPITVTLSNPSPTGTPRTGLAVVTELPRRGFFLESADTVPADRLVSFFPGVCLTPGAIFPPGGNTVGATPCAGGGTVIAQVVEGGAAAETVINFRNRSNPGQFKVCKIAGPGVPENTLFRFTVTGFGATNAADPQNAIYGPVARTVDVRAGFSTANSPNGNCQFVPGFGSGAGNAEFQTFINGTPVTV